MGFSSIIKGKVKRIIPFLGVFHAQNLLALISKKNNWFRGY